MTIKVERTRQSKSGGFSTSLKVSIVAMAIREGRLCAIAEKPHSLGGLSRESSVGERASVAQLAALAFIKNLRFIKVCECLF